MKKFRFLMMMAALATFSFSLSSCDDGWHDSWYDDPYAWSYGYGNWGWNNNYWNNPGGGDNPGGGSSDKDKKLQEEASALCANWQGTMDYSYIDDNTKRRVSQRRLATMEFYQLDSQKGTLRGNGIETDELVGADGKGTGETQTVKFKWYVDNNSDIYIQYQTENLSVFVMDAGASQYGFKLNDTKGTFQGYMMGTGVAQGDVAYIDLRRVDDADNAKASVLSRAAEGGNVEFGAGATLQPMQSIRATGFVGRR